MYHSIAFDKKTPWTPELILSIEQLGYLYSHSPLGMLINVTGRSDATI